MNKETKQITRALLKELRMDLDVALSAIAKKHGLLHLSAGNMRFDDMTVNIKVEGMAYPTFKVPVENDNDDESTFNFTPSAPLHTYIGREFMINGTKFTVRDVKTNRPKYPIVGVNTNGVRYKFSKEQMLQGLLQ